MSVFKKKVAILGSTGSIGARALNIIKENVESFEIVLISCNSNEKLFASQIKVFKPKHAVINSEKAFKNISKMDLGKTSLFSGEDSLCDLITELNIDIVVMAIVGFSALRPTISAIKSKKNIALASKETLVVAGEHVTGLSKKMNTKIIPVDSEHSAIFQCLNGEDVKSVDKLILTASGGPFRGKKLNDLKSVNVKSALNHPNWKMGNKITIDSATLMNKGFEVIEAKWLFDLPKEKIDVIVHPESIIHSMVEFNDSSIIAQLGVPSMNVPIHYALNFPNRTKSDFQRLDFSQIKQLNFEAVDNKTFKHLDFAYLTIEMGGSMGCVLNAANEIAVEAFLTEKISFLDMQKIIEKSIESITFVAKPTLEELFQIDAETRLFSSTLIQKNDY